MDPLLSSGVALITGAGSGIGQEISRLFAERGCKKLFLVDISMTGLAATEDLITRKSPEAHITLHIGNIGEEESVQEMVDECIKAYGRIDFACNNAGVGSQNIKTAEMTTEYFDKIAHINERGAFLCQSKEIAQMLEQAPLEVFGDYRDIRGSIVNTCSMSGLVAIETLSAYNASKHAVTSMMHVDARQYGPEKIRINSVCPGFVDTPMFRKGNPFGDSVPIEEVVRSAADQAPMRRMMSPRDIAESVVFLSSSFASGITGHSLAVDGGATLFRRF